MGNTTLSGGSISGEFKCTSILRASEMTFSVTTINPGDTVSFTVSPASAAFTHKVSWSLGNKNDSLSLGKGILSSSFTVPKEWTSEIISSSTSSLSVSLTTLNNGVTVGTKTYDVRFIIPATDEYKPHFEISLTRDNGNISDDFDCYIKGISALTVKPESMEFSYGASLAAVTMTVGDVSVRKIPATFNLNLSGEVLVTVAVRDTRGMLTVKTETISVYDYKKPSVEIVSVDRCNALGEKAALGTYGVLNYRVGYSEVNGNNKPSITLRYRKSTEEAYTYAGEIAASPFVFGEGGLAVGSPYILNICVCDRISSEETVTEAYISGGDVPFNIKKGGKGASFGKFAEDDMLLDVGWSLRVAGDMSIGGSINSESIGCECSKLTSAMLSNIRYYPCLNMVFLRLRLDTIEELSADSVHHVATISEKLPVVFTPLSAVTSYGTGSHSGAGITYGNGNVVLWSDKVIPQGSRIYINGFYMID